MSLHTSFAPKNRGVHSMFKLQVLSAAEITWGFKSGLRKLSIPENKSRSSCTSYACFRRYIECLDCYVSRPAHSGI